MGNEIIVGPSGVLRFIYDDDLASMLQDIGTLSIKRASYVEPMPDGRGWVADLSLVGGPILGPFELRSQALDEEAYWLRDHGIPIPRN